MDCERCDRALIDHAHGELEAAERGEVTRHLASCPTCAVAYCRLCADLDGVLLATACAPPARVRQGIRAELARSFRPPWWRRALAFGRAPVPAYALVAALLLPAALWLARGRGAPQGDAARADLSTHAAEAAPPRLGGYDAAAPLAPPRPIL